MEKFSNWRDGATGVAPFLPLPKPESSPAGTACGLILGLIRLPLVIVLTIFHFLLFQWLGPLNAVSIRLILMVLGVYRVSTVLENKRAPTPGKGDIIVSNFTSPLDPLIYSVLFDPLFVIPDGNARFLALSMPGAFRQALSVPTIGQGPSAGHDLAKLVDRARASGKLLVIFAEGTTTNGRGLLAIPDKGTPISNTATGRVYASAVRYNPPRGCSPVPQTAVRWVWGLVSCTGVNCTVRMSAPVEGKQTVAESICRVGRLRQLGLSANDKVDFYQAWKKYH